MEDASWIWKGLLLFTLLMVIGTGACLYRLHRGTIPSAVIVAVDTRQGTATVQYDNGGNALGTIPIPSSGLTVGQTIHLFVNPSNPNRPMCVRPAAYITLYAIFVVSMLAAIALRRRTINRIR